MLYQQAVVFLYPHRERELREYFTHINGTFASLASAERYRVIEFDRAVRSEVGRSNRKTLTEFGTYKRGQKRDWVAEKSELATLLGNIKTKLGTYRLRPYEPPQELSLEALEQQWSSLSQTEMHRAQLINETIRE